MIRYFDGSTALADFAGTLFTIIPLTLYNNEINNNDNFDSKIV